MLKRLKIDGHLTYRIFLKNLSGVFFACVFVYLIGLFMDLNSEKIVSLKSACIYLVNIVRIEKSMRAIFYFVVKFLS